ncbi:MAG: S8 family serine peptidase, partial [Ruminococcus sp.]|nr:S8 family serine peptidase [Ruminococcus sp.]
DEFKAVCLKSDSKSTEDLISELESNSAVKFAVPNYKKKLADITGDTYSGYQWALNNTGQEGGVSGKDTNADSLWSKAASSSKEQVVAIIDTGIDASHEDLKDVLWRNPYSSLPGTYGYDFSHNDSTPEDTIGHGTHCAGIVAGAANNNKGISGINTTNTKIMALKADDGEAIDADAEFAAYEYIEKAIDLGVNVTALNCSFGGAVDSQYAAEYREIYDNVFNNLGAKGVVTCVAAGNENININNQPYFPACCDSDYVITVAASDEYDDITAFSNYGSNYVDVAAPGIHILSTVPYYNFLPSVYTASQRSSLCSNFQDFSDLSNTSAFGLNLGGGGFSGATLDLSIDSGYYFGKTKNAVRLASGDDNYGSDGIAYYIEIPFTVSNTSSSYYVSFMNSFIGDASAIVADVPASYSVSNSTNLNAILNNGEEFGRYANPYRWYQTCFKSGPGTTGYVSATSRKLVLVFVGAKGPVYIDDIGISKLGVSESSFGKYDFYDGTSMASPYVAGAAALIKNAYNSYSAKDVANIIRTKGRTSSYLSNYVKNSMSLSLDNTTSYVPETPQPTVPATEDPTQPTAPPTEDSIQPTEPPTEDPTQPTTPTTVQTIPQVTGLRIDEVTESTIAFSYNPINIDGIQYSIEQKTDSSSWKTYDPVTFTSVEVSGLSSGTTYYYRVRALLNGEYGPYSSTISATTLSDTGVPAVTGLRVTDTTTDTVSIEWNSVGVSGAEYYIEVKTGSNDWREFGPTENTSVEFTGMSPNTTYYFRVRACVNGTYGRYSSTVTGKTKSNSSSGGDSSKTKITATVANSTVYVGTTTSVSVSVTNGVGYTLFTSSNNSVATVSSTGIITGKKEGTVTITAMNNGAKASVKVKIVKRPNPMTVKGKTITAKRTKNTTFAKAKAFTVKNAKGKVVFKKTSGNSKITVTSAGKVTVKKGLKKGTYKIKVKVTDKGNKTYRSKVKTVTVTVKVK